MLTEPTLRSRRFVTHLRNVACENDRTHQRGLAVVVFKRLIQKVLRSEHRSRVVDTKSPPQRWSSTSPNPTLLSRGAHF